eukprot:m51a1_g6025 guanosine-3',5'-bis(diphosphate) 3'-diphosphatase, putative (179) ;mRNA; f:101202-102038
MDLHKDQRRKGASAVPYINHCVEVAHEIASAGVTDIAVLQAAVLHDTVEDTDTTIEEIGREFGASVAGIVAEVTDDKTLTKRVCKELQVARAPGISREAKLVKLGDKVCNVRDLVCGASPWDVQKTAGYLLWAMRVVDGLRGASAELEARFDRCIAQFAHLPPPDQREAFLQEYYSHF